MLTMVTRHEKQYKQPTQTPGGGSALSIIDPGAEDWQDMTRNGCTSIPFNSVTFCERQGYGGRWQCLHLLLPAIVNHDVQYRHVSLSSGKGCVVCDITLW